MRLSLLACFAVALIACTSGEGRLADGEVRFLTITAWPQDSTYYTISGEPEVLVGFDLSREAFDGPRFRQVVQTLEKSGGNYLRLPTGIIDDEAYRELVQLANRTGVVLDTSERRGVRRVGSVAEFDLVLLEGAAGAVFERFDQRGLNAIRALLTVQSHLKLVDLQLDPSVVAGDPGGALAASDEMGNYAIYSPTVGEVELLLDGDQVARRVTVVGHLGTQRSETLMPPYDRQFTLLSDDSGGWIIIKRIGQ